MPNRSDIRDWVRQQTLVETDDFGNDKINAIIDEALNNISTRFDWPYLQKATTFTAVADQQAYALPADHARSHSIVPQGTSRRLREIAPALAWNDYGTQQPTGDETHSFFIWQNSFYLLPVPDSASVTYDHYYYRSPTLLTNDTDTPEFASQFHMVPADYVISKVWEREEDFVKAQQAMDDFDEGVERMARYYLDRANDSPLIVGERRDRLRSRANNTPWLDGV